MSELTNLNQEQKYTSVFLVEQINIFRKEEGNQTELLHKSLITKIGVEFSEEINEQNILPVTYKDAKGEQRKCFELNYEQSLQLLMSESKTVRKRCVEVMKKQHIQIQELKQQFEIPKTYAAALLEAGRLALELDAVTAKLIEAQPKVEFYDQVTDSTDSIDLGTAAKVLNLGFGRTTMFDKLRKANVLMSNNNPYQNYIDNGWFRVIETKWNKPNGDIHIYFKTMVFQKGLDGIRKLLAKNK